MNRSHNKSSFARRSFLKGLGISAAALGMRPLMPGAARADGEIPQRVVFIYDNLGLLHGSWEPLPAPGAPQATETEWELNRLMEPLARWKDRMLAFRGLEMTTSRRDPTGSGNAHVAGQTHALTAAFRTGGGDNDGGGISINELIARRMNSPMPLTRLESIHTGVLGFPHWGDRRWLGTFTGPQSAQPWIDRPPQLYDHLFPEELRNNPDAQQAQAQSARRSAIFDLIRSRGDALVRDLSTEQRTKVQQHMDTRADLERRLGIGGSTVRAANIPAPDMTRAWDGLFFGSSDENEKADVWSVQAELNMRMVAAAFHADISRVATITMVSPPNRLFGYEDGQFGAPDAHELTHAVSGGRNSDPAAVDTIRRHHLVQVEAIADFLEELEARVEPDGRSLLDHTLVVYTSEIGDGSHDLLSLPWFTIGDACGALRTGRMINLGRRDRSGRPVDIANWNKWEHEGRSHNDFFISIANAMGVDIDTFGEPSVVTGRIAEMFR